jgi:CRISPR type III-B/RAMP module RAMP protein Cmr6
VTRRLAALPDGSTNAALWLDRYFFDAAGEFFDAAGEGRKRNEQNAAFLRYSLPKLGVPDGYARAVKERVGRLREAGTAEPGVETRVYSIAVTGRIVCGMGIASVLENGLSLQRTWGMPVIPGSSLKGIVAARATRADDDAWRAPSEPGQQAGPFHRALFGDVTGAGFVTFHDAWWDPSSATTPFALDVITPHHVAYYTKGGDHPPADWDAPSPNSFLTVTGKFVGALVGPPAWLGLAERLLEEALAEDGVGAKTAAGYGRARLKRELDAKEMESEGALAAFKGSLRSVNGPGQFAAVVSALDGAINHGVLVEELQKALREILSPTVLTTLTTWARENPQRATLRRLLGAPSIVPESQPKAPVGEPMRVRAEKNRANDRRPLRVFVRRGETDNATCYEPDKKVVDKLRESLSKSKVWDRFFSKEVELVVTLDDRGRLVDLQPLPAVD